MTFSMEIQMEICNKIYVTQKIFERESKRKKIGILADFLTFFCSGSLSNADSANIESESLNAGA